jgi:CRISPR/Cas system Type II protein with McrA/HNH and RuvC-like nuclease domain
MSPDDEYYILDPAHTDPKRMKKEREKAQKLRKSQWWLSLVNRGLCHYCGRKFAAKELTMDHIVPLARGGTSSQGNIVPACRECNRDKKLGTPVESLLKTLRESGELAPNDRGDSPADPVSARDDHAASDDEEDRE